MCRALFEYDSPPRNNTVFVDDFLSNDAEQSSTKLDEDSVFTEKRKLALACLYDAQVAACRGRRDLLGRLRPSSAPTNTYKLNERQLSGTNLSPPVRELLLYRHSCSLSATTHHPMAIIM